MKCLSFRSIGNIISYTILVKHKFVLRYIDASRKKKTLQTALACSPGVCTNRKHTLWNEKFESIGSMRWTAKERQINET